MKNMVKNEIVLLDPYSNALCSCHACTRTDGNVKVEQYSAEAESAIQANFCDMGNMQSRNSMDKEAEINTRAGDKKRMKKLDKEIRKTLFFDKDLVGGRLV